MDTLLEFLTRMESLGDSEAVRVSNGLRTWTYSYQDLLGQVRRFSGFLGQQGLGKGDRLLLWCENRVEWVAVFWAALSRGVEVVPLDPHATARRVAHVRELAGVRLLVYGALTDPGIAGETFFAGALEDLPDPQDLTPSPADPGDIVEILFTSGTTSDAKGVVHRHRNICANLAPIDAEIQRYRRWARPFQPVRFLDVLPLSHMFGQAMGLFIPVLLGGSVVFLTDLDPGTLQRTIRRERVSVLVSVPRILESLAAHVESRHGETLRQRPVSGGVLRRWWRHRAIHGEFGWKFWAVVVGGAELDPRLETFWRQAGFLVVQGYGLTETSPVVAVNHPFHSKAGTLGRVIGDQEIKIADDGEILVRGSSVVDAYIGANSEVSRVRDAEGWFHTGDIGELDREGRLVFRGRKKDVIVTPDGLNVHPEDVERVLSGIPGVRAAVVVGERGRGGERTHAALILEEGTGASRVVEEANRLLEPQQRIQGWSLWPEEDFPRTSSTGKVQRYRVAASINQRRPGTERPSRTGASPLALTLAELTDRRPEDFGRDKTLAEDLALSSLERIDLLHGIEQEYGIRMDEVGFSNLSTIGELTSEIEKARRRGPAASAEPGDRTPVGPRWARHPVVRVFRSSIQALLLRPLLSCFVRLRVSGLEHLDAVSPPVLFAANHASNLDAPTVLGALPPSWRRRLAPAVRREFFFPPGEPGGASRLRLRAAYVLAAATFNVYPLPQHMGRVREALVYTGELASEGYCPLVFPEGERTPDGSLLEFRPGIGFMSLRLGVPVVPVYMDGLFEIMPTGARWPARGEVRVRIGEPLRPRRGESYRELTRRLESEFRSLERETRGPAPEGGPATRHPDPSDPTAG